ncbi:hypothetical protein K0M31_008289 [Melipona bicolor]|uniref:Uncharacterized protein n=1 Tax=Melipona bicolor TaxID=60889 RepID=A0AA40FQP4_9HYME|nr:hypothetical protein K0M31_008289 [Melipona bicolor]
MEDHETLETLTLFLLWTDSGLLSEPSLKLKSSSQSTQRFPTSILEINTFLESSSYQRFPRDLVNRRQSKKVQLIHDSTGSETLRVQLTSGSRDLPYRRRKIPYSARHTNRPGPPNELITFRWKANGKIVSPSGAGALVKSGTELRMTVRMTAWLLSITIFARRNERVDSLLELRHAYTVIRIGCSRKIVSDRAAKDERGDGWS